MADRRRILADCDGGRVCSDAGASLLGETDEAIELTDRFAECFVDRRGPFLTVHPLRTLLARSLLRWAPEVRAENSWTMGDGSAG